MLEANPQIPRTGLRGGRMRGPILVPGSHLDSLSMAVKDCWPTCPERLGHARCTCAVSALP